MAIMFEEGLKKTLSADKLLPVYILYGEDNYLKKLYSDKILKLISSPDDIFNCNKFSSSSDLQEIYNAVSQMPFMADKKFVEICDFDFEHAAKSDLDRFKELLSDVPESCVLIIRFDAISFDDKKSSKFKTLVTAAEKSGGAAVNLSHRKAPELIKMLCDGAAKRGVKMEQSAARYLIETAGNDIENLSNELIKLCAFSKDSVITKETVDNVSAKTVEASVFNLSKLILACDLSGALKTLDELLFMRIEPIIILSSISSVYIDMTRILAAKRSGLSIKDVAEKFGYKNKMFVLENAGRELNKSFDFKKLNLSLNLLKEADNSLKSFNMEPRIILEQLIVKLVYIIVKGENIG